jgi:hypothetical protein
VLLSKPPKIEGSSKEQYLKEAGDKVPPNETLNERLKMAVNIGKWRSGTARATKRGTLIRDTGPVSSAIPLFPGALTQEEIAMCRKAGVKVIGKGIA